MAKVFNEKKKGLTGIKKDLDFFVDSTAIHLMAELRAQDFGKLVTGKNTQMNMTVFKFGIKAVLKAARR